MLMAQSLQEKSEIGKHLKPLHTVRRAKLGNRAQHLLNSVQMESEHNQIRMEALITQREVFVATEVLTHNPPQYAPNVLIC